MLGLADMLFSAVATPRKLSLIAVLLFVIVIIYYQNSPHHDRLPTFSRPGSGVSLSDDNKSIPGSDQGRGNGYAHTPGSTQRPADDAPSRQELAGSGGQQDTQPGDWVKPGSAADGDTEPLHPVGGDTTTTATSLPETRPTVHHTFTPISHESAKTVSSKIQQLIKQWTPPVFSSHWPPYEYYSSAEEDYDPNRWEGFEWENDYYVRNGVKKLAEQHKKEAKPIPFLPYPAYNSEQWKQQWHGEMVSCQGPRGKTLDKSEEDWLQAYPVMVDGFPKPAVGSADVLGIDLNQCFDRYGRFGPYGFNQDETKRATDWKQKKVRPDWNLVRWGALQDRCLEANKERYAPDARQPVNRRPSKELPKDHMDAPKQRPASAHGKAYQKRTALLIRVWEGYVYTSNDIEAIRALITELNLLSGGEYQVFLFVNIKDRHADIFNNAQVYTDMLEQHIPRELHGISILWNEALMQEWYPKIGDWQVYWHQFMSLQWFSKMYPEYDFVWNWETDARYTGNHYQFLERIRDFAAKQPRKYLWERNARFYFPEAHGSYDAWLNDTHASIQTAIKTDNMQPVWGPQPYRVPSQPSAPFPQTPLGPNPPHALSTDDFEWGVTEEADLITLQPIWDPTNTSWTMRDKVWNFLPGIHPHFSPDHPRDGGFTHPDFATLPRRAFINTLARFSKRQLHAMHVENVAGRTMQAEMWPATVALHHGLKAVYAPHPIWLDHKWPAWYLDAVFNADGGETARWGAGADSVYNQDREHNFAGWSWYYASDFPRILYRRWLGWSASIGSKEQFPNNPMLQLGGEEFEEKGVVVEFAPQTPDGTQAAPAGGSFGGRKEKVGGMGRMCLPAMLLHPIKRVYLGAEDDALRGT